MLALLAALGGPGQPALAATSTITISSGALIYSGSNAGSNLTIRKISGTTYRFSDPNEGTISLGSGTAACSVTG